MDLKKFFILFFCVFSLSQAGNIILLCGTGTPGFDFVPVHPYTIAFYRLALAFLIFLPFGLKATITNIKNSDRKTLIKVISMGLIFAFHLIFWIKAVHYTKVANAAICYSILPVFISIGAYWLWKEQLHKNIFIAIFAGIIGIFLVGYNDFSTSLNDLIGDIFSMISALLFAVYFLIGKSVRENKDNLFIMIFVYLFSSIMAFIMVTTTWTNSYQLNNSSNIIAPIWGFNTKTWVGFFLLAIVPTILGHAIFIYISKYFKANVTSTFILLEPVFAGFIAYLAYNQQITILTFIGYVCIIIGLSFLTWTQAQVKEEQQKQKVSTTE